MKKLTLVIGTLFVAAGVLAQAVPPAAAPASPLTPARSIGRTLEVEGLVTVSDGTVVRTVVKDAPVIDGARYITSANGRTVLRLDNGCELRLAPSQVFTARANETCDALLASIQTLSDSNVAAAPFFGGGGALAAALLGAGVLAAANNASAQPPAVSNQ